MSNDSSVYQAAARILDDGFQGTYGELGRAIGTIGRAVGPIVRKYARRNPGWEHGNVVSKRSGYPANS
jgi:hypothetical protein